VSGGCWYAKIGLRNGYTWKPQRGIKLFKFPCRILGDPPTNKHWMALNTILLLTIEMSSAHNRIISSTAMLYWKRDGLARTSRGMWLTYTELFRLWRHMTLWCHELTMTTSSSNRSLFIFKAVFHQTLMNLHIHTTEQNAWSARFESRVNAKTVHCKLDHDHFLSHNFHFLVSCHPFVWVCIVWVTGNVF
jgi:hypothetical protein